MLKIIIINCVNWKHELFSKAIDEGDDQLTNIKRCLMYPNL